MSKQELYNELIKIMNYYSILIDHNQIIRVLCEKYLSRFPENLPNEIKEAVKKDKPIVQKEINEIANQGLDKTPKEAFSGVQESLNRVLGELEESISFAIVNLMTRKEDLSTKFGFDTSDYYDFKFSVNGQSLLFLNSILEGYLYQIIVLLQKLNPDVTIPRKYKYLEWRLKTLKNKFDIQIEDNPSFINLLKKMEQIRHIIVHNNGLVDQEFIDKTGYTSLKVGKKFVVENQIIGIAGIVTSWLVRETFRLIMNKHFKEFTKQTVRLEFRPGSIKEIKEEK